MIKHFESTSNYNADNHLATLFTMLKMMTFLLKSSNNEEYHTDVEKMWGSDHFLSNKLDLMASGESLNIVDVTLDILFCLDSCKNRNIGNL